MRLRDTETTSCRGQEVRPSRCCPPRRGIAREKSSRRRVTLHDSSAWLPSTAATRKSLAARLFLETMEEVLPRLRKTIVDENGNLDLTLVRTGTSSRSSQP